MKEGNEGPQTYLQSLAEDEYHILSTVYPQSLWRRTCFPVRWRWKTEDNKVMITLFWSRTPPLRVRVLTHRHSPLGTAHHCHDQRQREDVKAPCFPGTPHPLSDVWMNGWCPAFNKWLNERMKPRCSRSHRATLKPGETLPTCVYLCVNMPHEAEARLLGCQMWSHGSGAVKPQTGRSASPSSG